MFSKIARENFQALSALETKVGRLRHGPPETSLDNKTGHTDLELLLLEEEVAKFASIVIVFSAIAIEAYIYDYAARHLTDSFVQNYIDKLDPVGKWVLIPRLITGRELPRTHRWLELLTNLVKERNSIIHSKSSELPASPVNAHKYLAKIGQEREITFQKSKHAIQLLDLLITEVSKLDPDESFWIESHLGK